MRIALTAVACAVALAACGSSSKPAVGQPAASASKGDFGLTYSRCMRAHGVPTFPDPTGGGGTVKIQIGGDVNPQSPAFQSGQAACRKLLPGGGPASGPRSAQAHAQLLATSECMRAHGISGFPDPTTSPPSLGGSGSSAVLGRGGYFLAIPSSIDVQSPAFKQAAMVCNFGPRGGKATAVP